MEFEKEEQGDVKEFLEHDLQKRNDLRVKVEVAIKKLCENNDQRPFFASGLLENLGDGLYEIRVPKTCSGGVVRIYYCYPPGEPNTLELLTAELKKGKKGKQIPKARRLMTQFYEWCRSSSRENR